MIESTSSGSVVRSPLIDKLHQHHKLHAGHGFVIGTTSMRPRPTAAEAVVDFFLVQRQWRASLNCFHNECNVAPFTLLQPDTLLALAIEVTDVLKAEPTIVETSAPTRIFGDIHGQLLSMLGLFHTYGYPESSSGVLDLTRFIFNGDFVDRGPNSLEVVALLFALKILHPDRIILVRGNHEDAVINATHGFLQECHTRLPPDAAQRVWHAINVAFQYLPLAALISNRVLVLHGGIGQSLQRLSEISELQRPIAATQESQLLLDILWSDPAEHDGIPGIQENDRGPNIVKYVPCT